MIHCDCGPEYTLVKYENEDGACWHCACEGAQPECGKEIDRVTTTYVPRAHRGKP